MFVIAEYLLDISVQAQYHYPNNRSVYYLQIIGVVFYLSCAGFILFPRNKWNKIALLIAACLLIGIIFLNKDIQKTTQNLSLHGIRPDIFKPTSSINNLEIKITNKNVRELTPCRF